MTRGISSYDPKFAPIAQRMFNAGMTETEVAEYLGVAQNTLNGWKAKHPEFAVATQLGKEGPDNRVKAALFQRCVGFKERIKKGAVDKKTGKLIEWEEEIYYPPDTIGCIFWLKNRDNENWSDKPGENKDRDDFDRMSDRELADMVRTKGAKLLMSAGADAVVQEAAEAKNKKLIDVTPKKK